MFLLFTVVLGSALAGPDDPNVAMNKVISIVTETAEKSHPFDDYIWEKKLWILRFWFRVSEISFWDPTTLMSLEKTVVSEVGDQTRLEATLSLTTMQMHYGRYELYLPYPLGTTGSADFELGFNTFGMTAYYGADCNLTRVYIWQPHGNPRLYLSSGSDLARWVEYFFSYFGSGLVQNIIDYNMIGGALDAAMNEPLRRAINTVFCESK